MMEVPELGKEKYKKEPVALYVVIRLHLQPSWADEEDDALPHQ